MLNITKLKDESMKHEYKARLWHRTLGLMPHALHIISLAKSAKLRNRSPFKHTPKRRKLRAERNVCGQLDFFGNGNNFDSQGVDELATFGRYHHIHGHSSLCA